MSCRLATCYKGWFRPPVSWRRCTSSDCSSSASCGAAAPCSSSTTEPRWNSSCSNTSRGSTIPNSKRTKPYSNTSSTNQVYTAVSSVSTFIFCMSPSILLFRLFCEKPLEMGGTGFSYRDQVPVFSLNQLCQCKLNEMNQICSWSNFGLLLSFSECKFKIKVANYLLIIVCGWQCINLREFI